jgi:hypothetical protein
VPTRIGIELSPAACRIVELDRSERGEGGTVVRSFSRAPAADEATLAPYRRRHVSVVVWGLRGEYRQAVVTVGSYQRMRREAVNAMREAGVDTRQMVADIAPATMGREGGRRRPVVVALARTSDIAASMRPLTAAGIRVRSIVTPALALMSLARMRRSITAPGMAEAYIALEEAATAIALVRDGALVAARELEWGYRNEDGARPRDEVASSLGDAIEEFFGDCGVRPNAVAQICVCGGLPELRSMTVALMERLDVEVEPLDSLFGIDADHLPEPADDFLESVVDLRLAWAVAGDWNAPINFLRERRRRLAKIVLTRAAVVAGVATGLGVAWQIGNSDLLDPQKRSVSPPVTPAPPPTQVARPVPAAAQATAPVVQQPPEREPTRNPTPKPALVLTPVPAPPARADVVVQPPVRLTPVPDPVSAPPARAELAPPREPVRPAARPVRRPPPDDVVLPFDAALGTILYGPDRRLAIVDGRIIQVGDDVRGARIVDITPNAVLLRDRQGRLRRLTLEDPVR